MIAGFFMDDIHVTHPSGCALRNEAHAPAVLFTWHPCLVSLSDSL
jgi:hypothetical protein